MIVSFLMQLVSEIESISDETIYDFSLSLLAVKEEEKIVGILSEEGKRIYSLLTLKENEIDKEDLSILEKNECFSSVEEDNLGKDYKRIIKLEDEIRILEDILFMEVQEVVGFFFEGGSISSEDFNFAFREGWQIVEVEMSNRIYVNTLFYPN